jgi:nucleotide-binding universal stress UspA family protein
MRSIRRILFATDLSQASERAFEQAADMAGGSGAELLIAHAYQPPTVTPTDAYLSAAMYEQLDVKLRETAAQQLERFARLARERGVAARALLLAGPAHEAISEAVKEEGADLIIMGTHGRTGPARFFLGSVAARVVSEAPCPVLTIRAA